MTTSLGLNNYSCINESYSNPNVNKTNCADFPVYASLIRFELHRDNQTKKYSIKFYFNNDTYDICYSKKLDNTFCDFKKFSKVLQSRILSESNFNKICGIESESSIFSVD